MCGAVSARLRRSAAWHGGLFVVGAARRDCFSQCNAGADLVQALMWCIVISGEAGHDYFSQCNAGANVLCG